MKQKSETSLLSSLLPSAALGLGLLVAGCASFDFKADVPPEEDARVEKDVLEATPPDPLSVQLTEHYKPQVKGDVKRGEALFKALCSSCHVEASERSMVKFLSGYRKDGRLPPSFKSKEYDADHATDYLFLKIKYGGKKTVTAHSMPSWESVLSDEDINDLVAYVMHLAKKG